MVPGRQLTPEAPQQPAFAGLRTGTVDGRRKEVRRHYRGQNDGLIYIVRLNKKYYAILVTTPPVHMYGYLSDKLCAPPDRPAVINWNYKGRNNIPSMVASLAFRRHFALCLVRKEVWESTNKTLAQKFENQLFWDYYGQSTQYSRASCWSLRNIITINAIQELGIVKSDKDATQKCTECKQKSSHNPY